MDTDRQRAKSFGDVAQAYQRARPTYPPAAVSWVLDPAPGRRVLDLAAGTGKLTRALLRAGADTVAVEPLDGMREQLERAYPEVASHAGTAEEIPLEDDSVDAVMVGQAFHWFDKDRSLAEIARVLRPHGVIGLLWNIRDDRIRWVAEFSRMFSIGADLLSQLDGDDWDSLGADDRFDGMERRDFDNPTPFDAQKLVTWASSTSQVAIMSDADRAATLEQVRAFATRRPGLGDEDHFTMPFVTVAIRARLVSR
jgi:SAM-dependent methyltransferase